MTKLEADKKGIHLLVLAAGESRRFGSDKRQALLPTGRSLLEQSLHIASVTGLPCSFVCRPNDPLAAQLPSVLYVEEAVQGMGSSIAGAVALLKAEAHAILVLPLDLPLLRSDTILRVAERCRPDQIVRPGCNGRHGHPVGFGSSFFEDLIALGGEEGAQSVIRAHTEALQAIEVEDVGIYCDIDTPAALSELTLSQFPEEHR